MNKLSANDVNKLGSNDVIGFQTAVGVKGFVQADTYFFDEPLPTATFSGIVCQGMTRRNNTFRDLSWPDVLQKLLNYANKVNGAVYSFPTEQDLVKWLSGK